MLRPGPGLLPGILKIRRGQDSPDPFDLPAKADEKELRPLRPIFLFGAESIHVVMFLDPTWLALIALCIGRLADNLIHRIPEPSLDPGP